MEKQYKTIIIMGRPVPLQRARLGKGVVYDPQKAQKHQIIQQYLLEGGEAPCFQGALDIDIKFFFSRPKKMLKRDRLRVFFNKRPDLTNLCKFYEDLFNQCLWKDDAQIVRLVAEKRYGDIPRTEINIRLCEE